MKSYGMITKLLVVALMLMGAIVAPQSLYAQCVTPPSGMVAWWPLDETSGPTAHDLAGVDNAGTWMNNPTPVPGKVAGALSFNGSNSVDVPDQAELIFGTGDFSIDWWIKTTDASGTRTILDKRTGSLPNVTGYSLYLYNGYLGLHLGDGAGWNNWTSTGFVADGSWHHVAVTVDRDNPSGLIFYVDGSHVSTFDPTGRQGNLTNTAPFVMARNLISPSYTFAGTLDEIELFNRVLDSLEVRSIWAADSFGKCKTTIGVILGSDHVLTIDGTLYADSVLLRFDLTGEIIEVDDQKILKYPDYIFPFDSVTSIHIYTGEGDDWVVFGHDNGPLANLLPLDVDLGEGDNIFIGGTGNATTAQIANLDSIIGELKEVLLYVNTIRDSAVELTLAAAELEATDGVALMDTADDFFADVQQLIDSVEALYTTADSEIVPFVGQFLSEADSQLQLMEEIWDSLDVFADSEASDLIQRLDLLADSEMVVDDNELLLEELSDSMDSEIYRFTLAVDTVEARVLEDLSRSDTSFESFRAQLEELRYAFLARVEKELVLRSDTLLARAVRGVLGGGDTLLVRADAIAQRAELLEGMADSLSEAILAVLGDMFEDTGASPSSAQQTPPSDCGFTTTNTISGSGWLFGTTENDEMTGGPGTDFMIGCNGKDRMHGGGGDDLMCGDLIPDPNNNSIPETDDMYGDGGDDFMFGNEGIDCMYGGEDIDIMCGNTGNDYMHGNEGRTITITLGSHTLSFEAGDIMCGDDDDDEMYGDEGLDVMCGNTGLDKMHGGDGADFMYGDADDDMMYGEAGKGITFDGYSPPIGNFMCGNTGKDQMWGGIHNDFMWGNEDDDKMHGGNATDIMEGNQGNDEMYGDAGMDGMTGNRGNDIMSGGDATDAMLGDEGNDEMYGDDGTDGMWGNEDDDKMRGGDATDVMEGNQGNDEMYGDDGIDAMTGNRGNDKMSGDDGMDFMCGNEGNDEMNGNAGTDWMWGNEDDDKMRGSDGTDVMEGNEGNDEMYGDDGIDAMTGNQGNDKMSGGDDADGMEGNQGNDEMNGDAGFDIMWGDEDDDKMHGGPGNDWMWGNEGKDEMYGNTGTDVMEGNRGNDWMDGGDDIDAMTGNQDDDIMFGSPGRDWMFGNEGKDHMDGGDGNDKMFGDEDDDIMFGSPGRDWMEGNDGHDCMDGGDDKDKMFGNQGNDRMFGGNGADWMNGNEGDDCMEGDAGNDRNMYGNEGNDIVNGNDGDDRMWGNRGNDLMDGGDDDDRMRGNRDDDQMYGGFGDDFMRGNTGGDIMYGGPGDDNMDGGWGNNTVDQDGPSSSGVTCTRCGGTVIITKNTIGGNGTFSYSGTGPFSNFAINTTNGTGSQMFANVAPGNYAVGELGPPMPWFFTSLVCTDPDGGTTVYGKTAYIDLDPGENVVCTYTNTKHDTCVQAPSGMVAWWPLDETSGSIVYEQQASWNNNGTTTPGPIGPTGPVSVPAVVSTGLLFPAQNWPRYVIVGNDPDINFGTGDFSIDAWIKPEWQGIVQPIVDKLDTNYTGYRFFVTDNVLCLKIGSGFGLESKFSTVFVTYGVWNHVAVTVHRSTPPDYSVVTFYINGALAGSGPMTSLLNDIDTPIDLWIGNSREITLPNEFGEIAIDELEMFKRELLQSEVQLIYDAGYHGKCKRSIVCGDDNGDEVIDVGDVVFCINYLFRGGPLPDPLEAGDANYDGGVDIGDVVYLINYLFRSGPPPCEDRPNTSMGSGIELYKGKAPAQIGFFSPVISKDGVFETTVLCKSDMDVTAVQLEIKYDPEKTVLLEPALTPRTEGLQLFSSIKAGIQKIGILDLSGEHYISAGAGALVTLRGKGTDLNSLKISQVLLVDRNAQRIQSEIVSEMKKPDEDLAETKSAIPQDFSLSQNYPNPFNPETEISYALPTDCQVKLTIYNVAGQKVRTLVDGHQTAGFKTILWNGKDNDGKELASGVYFYKIQAGAFTDARKMILMK